MFYSNSMLWMFDTEKNGYLKSFFISDISLCKELHTHNQPLLYWCYSGWIRHGRLLAVYGKSFAILGKWILLLFKWTHSALPIPYVRTNCSFHSIRIEAHGETYHVSALVQISHAIQHSSRVTLNVRCRTIQYIEKGHVASCSHIFTRE